MLAPPCTRESLSMLPPPCARASLPPRTAACTPPVRAADQGWVPCMLLTGAGCCARSVHMPHDLLACVRLQREDVRQQVPGRLQRGLLHAWAVPAGMTRGLPHSWVLHACRNDGLLGRRLGRTHAREAF